MKKSSDILNVLRLSFVFTGGVIGAGFASGKEIYEFFIIHGNKWILGLLICGVILSLSLFGIIKTANSNKEIHDYESFMAFAMGKTFGKIMENICGIFLFVLFFAMVSASGSLAVEAFSVKYFIGVSVILGFCLLIFIKGDEGIVKLNSFVAPVLIGGCIFLGINAILSKSEVPVFNLTGNSWLFSALLYSSYNIITIIPVIVPLRKLAETDKKAFLCGVAGGMGIFAIGLSIGAVLWFCKREISGNIPLLSALSDYRYTSVVYKIVLLSAIFTTAAANGYGAMNWMKSKVKRSGFSLYLIILALGAVFSRIGFSGFVEVLYPLFGYLGIAQIIIILFLTFMKGNINCK